VEAEIREAGPRDLETLLDWRMRVLADVFAGSPLAASPALRGANAAYYRRHLADGTHTACFAVDPGTGRTVGCGGVCHQEEMPSPDNPSGRNAYLMDIYVLPGFRGRGIGRRIVRHLVAAARARGAGKIYLESTPAARPLYRSLGFGPMHGMMIAGDPP